MVSTFSKTFSKQFNFPLTFSQTMTDFHEFPLFLRDLFTKKFFPDFADLSVSGHPELANIMRWAWWAVYQCLTFAICHHIKQVKEM